jgi:uncharacterized protein with PIN domain
MNRQLHDPRRCPECKARTRRARRDAVRRQIPQLTVEGVIIIFAVVTIIGFCLGFAWASR